MRRISISLFLAILVFVAAVDGASKYIQPASIDYKALLTTAPAQDSELEKQEMDEVLWLQRSRTPDEEKRAQSEVTISAFSFSDVLGDWFNAKDLPVTAALTAQMWTDGKPIADAAKDEFGRKRPFQADPRVKPCVIPEDTPSFPSGHSTRATMWALVLSEIFPEHRAALMARAYQIGDDRVLAGMHFPSDVEAGRKLGRALAEKFLADPAFKADLEKAKAECLSHAVMEPLHK